MIQRLKWQKVWILNPPEESSIVRSIAWRSDEKILSIGNIQSFVYLPITINFIFSIQHWPDPIGGRRDKG
jgi:hypothetical protein